MEHLVFISHSSEDKSIADAICRHLEKAGIHCWIAPRDIRHSDWAASIMDGLRLSDVFVVIISRHSIASGEVTKEVTEATHVCQYILPFRVDHEELSKRLRYHLGPCHWLDAVSPPLEQWLDELTQRILNLSGEDSVYTNQNQWKLLERISWPRPFFTGREEEIRQIAEILEKEHVLFLQGMGGIGKSELAKGYAQAFRNRYDTIIFAGYAGNLVDVMNGDEVFIENLRRSTETESAEAFFRRKLQVLKQLSSPRVLLILDNFDVEDDPHLEDLIHGPYHLLITSRFEHYGYPVLHIGKIGDFAKVRQIFADNYGRPLHAEDRKTVDEILRLADCHTITVELIARQMRASFIKPQKMLALLRDSGINTRLKEKIKREGSPAQHTSFEYIRELFQLSKLSQKEQHILCCMCMVPQIGIEIPLFGEICGLEDYDGINSLLSKSWLMLDEKTDTLILHPVIADVVREQLHPTPLLCQDYVIGLWKKLRNCWYYTTEERNALSPYLFFFLRTFPEPQKELWLQYGDFGNCAWICGNFELSIQSCLRFYKMTLREFGPETVETGMAATWLGGAYHNSGDNDSAEPYYRQGLEARLAVLGSFHRDVAVSYGKLGRCAYLKKHFKEAEKYLNKAMKIFARLYAEASSDEERREARYYSGDTIVELERLWMEQGNYEKALKYCQESYDIFYSRNRCEIANSAYSLVDMGICCSALGRYEDAESYLNRALELNLSLNGKTSVQTVRTRTAIADNAARQHDRERAEQLYLELELDLEKDFGPENPQVKHIREKRQSLSI